MSVVIDASVTLAWVYSDERSAPIERIFSMVVEDVGWVPAIWHLEVANGLQQGIRRRRIDKDFRDGALTDLAALELAVDADTSAAAWHETLRLADRFRLTLYDACYLELAQRKALPLATLDRDHRKAGESLGLELLGI